MCIVFTVTAAVGAAAAAATSHVAVKQTMVVFRVAYWGQSSSSNGVGQ